MLKEFIEVQQRLPQQPLPFPYSVPFITHGFNSLVDFLRDETKFPNPEVNKVMTLMWRLIGNHEIPQTLDQWGVSDLSFLIFGSGIERMGLYVVQRNFVQMLRSDPVNEIGAVVLMASQGRDYYTGRLVPNSVEAEERGRAFEADALLTVEKMSKEEGIDVAFNDLLKDVMATYPEGLRSLPPGRNYPTPEYTVQNFRDN